MNSPRSARRFAWMAALAILLGALVPLLARAAAQRAGGPPGLQLCTAQGMRYLAADPAASQEDGGHYALAAKCPLCTLQAALPPPVAQLPSNDRGGRAGAPLPLGAGVPPAPSHWCPANPRAPPRSALIPVPA
ncbi:hypothetical protein B4966_05610 [Rhodocyclaceae bacterium]|jgi:hypothetical protein|nr:hypothetical protein B4966_05610 [Rhodocyclaceae bacterium]